MSRIIGQAQVHSPPQHSSTKRSMTGSIRVTRSEGPHAQSLQGDKSILLGGHPNNSGEHVPGIEVSISFHDARTTAGNLAQVVPSNDSQPTTCTGS
jgi:hypothetical protein